MYATLHDVVSCCFFFTDLSNDIESLLVSPMFSLVTMKPNMSRKLQQLIMKNDPLCDVVEKADFESHAMQSVWPEWHTELWACSVLSNTLRYHFFISLRPVQPTIPCSLSLGKPWKLPRPMASATAHHLLICHSQVVNVASLSAMFPLCTSHLMLDGTTRGHSFDTINIGEVGERAPFKLAGCATANMNPA